MNDDDKEELSRRIDQIEQLSRRLRLCINIMAGFLVWFIFPFTLSHELANELAPIWVDIIAVVAGVAAGALMNAGLKL